MSRNTFRAAMVIVMLAAFVLQSAQAQQVVRRRTSRGGITGWWKRQVDAYYGKRASRSGPRVYRIQRAIPPGMDGPTLDDNPMPPTVRQPHQPIPAPAGQPARLNRGSGYSHVRALFPQPMPIVVRPRRVSVSDPSNRRQVASPLATATPAPMHVARGVQTLRNPTAVGSPPVRMIRYAGSSHTGPAGIGGFEPGPPAYKAGSYPYLESSLYPTPRPDIPYQVGGAVITNQALAAHEMLYPHTYRALYPPFYYKVAGAWLVTPSGVWSHDTWKLQGTEVEVKYHSRIGVLSGYVPPVYR